MVTRLQRPTVQVLGFGQQAQKVQRFSQALQAHFGITVPVTVRRLKVQGDTTRAFAYNLSSGLGICVFADCPAEDLWTVLAHEWVHVWQNFTGRLYLQPEAQIFTWCDVEWGPRELAAVAYRDRPWEVEAYGMQAELVAKFLG